MNILKSLACHASRTTTPRVKTECVFLFSAFCFFRFSAFFVIVVVIFVVAVALAFEVVLLPL